MIKPAKKNLVSKATENARVTKGTKNNQEVLKEGIPNDHHRKQMANVTTVGANIGITKNMDNYESLRIDVWLSDSVGEKETVEEAYERVVGVIDKVLQNTLNSYIE